MPKMNYTVARVQTRTVSTNATTNEKTNTIKTQMLI